MKNKNEIKAFLTGLGIGSVLAGAGVFLSDPDNREKVKEKADEFKSQADDLLDKLQSAAKDAKSKGEDVLVTELEEAEKALREAQKRIK